MATYNMTFPNLSAVSDFISKTPRTWRNRESEDAPARDYWDLGAGYAGALDLALNGWKQGAASVAKGMEALKPNATISVRQYAPYGSRPSAVRFATGNPRCMVRTRSDAKAKPAIVLAVQIGAMGASEAQHLSNYGLAVAAYVQELTSKGFIVELIACDVATSSGNRLVVSWTVKSMGAPMNLSDVAFSIGHAAAFRRLSFAVQERSNCPEMSGYGGAGKALASDFASKGGKVLVINGMETAHRHSKTPESALAHVKLEIAAAMELAGIETPVS